jgi:hypothetical protein
LDLAAKGNLFKFGPKRTPVYFAHDPLDRLDSLAREHVSEPVPKAQLKARLLEHAPGHKPVFEAWLKRALSNRLLFQHGGKPRESYGREPDVDAILRPVLTSLRTALSKANELGIPRQRFADALLKELGVSPPPADGTPRTGRSAFLSALARLASEESGTALLSVRKLRRRLDLSKEAFDALAVSLAREGVVSLHHHDYPSSLSPSERDELVLDTHGTHYVGIAPRGGT